MKPITLTLTGFRSYPTQTTIDFTGKNLVAVLGDTGAGRAASSTPSASPSSVKVPGTRRNPASSLPTAQKP